MIFDRKKGNYPLKIAYVTDTYPPDVNGVATSLSHIIQHIKEFHEVLVLRPEDDFINIRIQRRLKEIFFPYFQLPFYKEVKLGLPLYQKVYDSLRAFSPDIVHIVTEGPLGLVSLLVAKQLGIPIVSDYRTNITDYLKFYSIDFLSEFLKYYLLYFHNQCDLTFVPTKEVKIQLKKNGIRNVKVVGRGVDVKNFHYSKQDPEFRKELGIEDTDLLFLYVGRVAQEKNLDLVCEVFRQLKTKYRNIHFVIVGDGPYRSYLETQYKEIRFLGTKTKEELARIYASSDLFLFPSKTETFGNVIMEAFASGLPAIAYSYASAKLVYHHKKTGILIPLDKKKQKKAWYQYLEKIIKHPKKIETWKANIRKEYGKLQQFSWEGIASQLSRYYYQVIAKMKNERKIINL